VEGDQRTLIHGQALHRKSQGILQIIGPMVFGRLTLKLPLPLLPANPINTPVIHDLIHPLRERCRVIQPLNTLDECQPRLLHGVPCGILVAGEEARMPPQPLLPPPHQFLECLPVTILASQDQQLVNYPFTALHPQSHIGRTRWPSGSPAFRGVDKSTNIGYIAVALQISR
jgi:hypothetical protein